jgi:hypothetical protein
LKQSLEIADGDGPAISIADVFAGREPQRVDAHAARGGEATLGFRVELTLDSQVVTYLDQFVRGSHRLTELQRKLVIRLLRFAVKKRIGYNPAFYFLEALSRPGGQERAFARETARSILALHTMDTDHFLRTSEVRASIEGQEVYIRDYNCRNFDEVVETYVNGFVDPTAAVTVGETPAHRIRYATLLAIAAIHRRRPATNWEDVCKKCEAFDDFLGQLGGEMGLERMVAVRYFMGGLDSFLPLQKGARVDKVLARIRAAVWDVDFLNMPAFLLVQPPRYGVVVGYPCTADRLLAALAGSFTLELVIAPKGEPRPTPVFAFREGRFRHAMAIRGRTRPWPDEIRRLEEAEVETLVADLESQVISLC